MKETNEKLDAVLDVLADAVAKRLAERAQPPRIVPAPAPTQVKVDAIPEPSPEPKPESVVEPEPQAIPPMPSHAASLMARLIVGVLVAVILINIPLNMQGTALARSIPNSASLIIANGLLVKAENSPDVWVYRDGAFHWITSLDAFNHMGFRWENVHIVEPGFLDDFEKGKPYYVLLKCDYSPHIFRLEGGRKRWIVDIPTLEAEGHVWTDVRIVSCPYLRDIPDGDSIPPGRGTPLPPLP